MEEMKTIRGVGYNRKIEQITAEEYDKRFNAKDTAKKAETESAPAKTEAPKAEAKQTTKTKK